MIPSFTLRLWVLLLCSIPIAISAQRIDPYLQAMTPNAIVVNWKTAVPATSRVKLGTSENQLLQTITGTSASFSDVGYSNNYFYHTVQLRDLQPATKYYYQVVSGTDTSAVASFRTLPLPGNAPNASGHLRFLILGDNQIKAYPRYDSLMVAARRKLTELYGTDYNDSVSFILNLGDQVDVGTLDHYEHVHLKKSRYMSDVLPIQTAVGNHETYGTLKMKAYYDHFVLDSMNYKGIYSGTEDYYAFQAGNVVIAYMNTENTGGNQLSWIRKIIDTANADPSVKWIITIAHRPYQAEQYVGDISPWIRNTVVPYCMQSPKYILHVGAHHHLYARGQLKDQPVYHIISGGTAWDQYWGMASEQNFDDVQKTISQWAYQLVDVDMINDRFDMVTYSIGSIYGQKNNVPIDSVHRYSGKAAPAQPAITNPFPDSLQLPLTLTASAFQSPAGEALNSTEFQVALDRNFSVIEKTAYRHFEDLFGSVTGATPDTSKDQNLGLDITRYTLPAGALPNGKHYTRVRYRDRNMSWSGWSVTDSFRVYNSIVYNPAIRTDTTRYATGSTITVTFTNGSANPAAWIGIYRKGQTPGSANPSVTWKYTNAANGTLTFTLSTANEYFAAYFGDAGYTEIAPRAAFYYGSIPVLNVANANYSVGQAVPITYTNGPALSKDWIGIYKIGQTPGGPASTKWTYVTASNGTYNVTGLAKGYYFAAYFLQDQYAEASSRVYFSVGDTITRLSASKTQYNLGEYISATWVDGPGNPKDWLGIYRRDDNPNIDPLISYTYIEGRPNGSKDIADTSMPQQPGNYFLVLFTNDSYNEVSNRVYFQMLNGVILPVHLAEFTGKAEGASHLIEWRMTDESSAVRYVLQHSADGIHYQDIYLTVKNPSLQGLYRFYYDQAVKGRNYYRLKMTDADNRETYSHVITINGNGAGSQNAVSIYPNPAKANTTSVIESPYPIDQIDVLDASGKLIYQSRNINTNRFSLLHQDLPPGTYFLQIHSRKLYTAKLIISR